MRKPNLFIVGAPKCGTTSLYTYLQTHPDIAMSRIKEPHYFGSDFEAKRFKRHGLDFYFSLWADAGDAKWLGEASIYYLYSRVAAQEIHDFNPDSRIIILVRNPVDMLYSYYYEKRFQGEEPLATFGEALAAEDERKRGRLLPPNLSNMPESLYYRDVARFTGQIRRYHEVFGPDKVRVIVFDDLKADALSVYRDTLAFLGLDLSSVSPDMNAVNPSKVPRSSSITRFFHDPPVWWRYGPIALGRLLVPKDTRRKVNLLIKRLNTRYEKRPAMEPSIRQQLMSEFYSEIEQLSALLDRDLMHWVAENHHVEDATS